MLVILGPTDAEAEALDPRPKATNTPAKARFIFSSKDPPYPAVEGFFFGVKMVGRDSRGDGLPVADDRKIGGV